jgi:hypothetical protein
VDGLDAREPGEVVRVTVLDLAGDGDFALAPDGDGLEREEFHTAETTLLPRVGNEVINCVALVGAGGLEVVVTLAGKVFCACGWDAKGGLGRAKSAPYRKEATGAPKWMVAVYTGAAGETKMAIPVQRGWCWVDRARKQVEP